MNDRRSALPPLPNPAHRSRFNVRRSKFKVQRPHPLAFPGWPPAIGHWSLAIGHSPARPAQPEPVRYFRLNTLAGVDATPGIPAAFLASFGMDGYSTLIGNRTIKSQCARHRRNLPATPPDEHHLKASLSSLGHRQIYFVDNVATSGNTMRAAFAAMHRGAGLVFADGGHNARPQDEPNLL
jgi:hypothetical protein